MPLSSVVLFVVLLHFTNGARPFYIIGHMANTVDEAKDFIGRGANAIEVDVNFKTDNVSDISAFHGLPCDCFRVCRRTQPLHEILQFVQGQSKRLALLFLDIKLGSFPDNQKKSAGQALANHLQRYLWKNANPKTKVLMSIERPSDQEAVLGVISSLDQEARSYIGWDISMNFPLEEIRTTWKNMDIDYNQLWQGDGITNCLSPFRGFERLREALRERNKNKGYISKVYHWTIDFRFLMRYSLEHRVDGMITNHPERAVEVLREFGPRVFRLATPQDDPWLKMPDPPQISQTYPDESNLRRLLRGFSLLQAGRDLRDSARNLFGELLSSAGSNLVGRQLDEDADLREVFSFLESVDQSNISLSGVDIFPDGDANNPLGNGVDLFGGADRGIDNNDRRVDNNDRRGNNNDRREDNNDRRVDNNDRRVYNNDRNADNNGRRVDNNERREDNDRRVGNNDRRDNSNDRRVDSNDRRENNNDRRVNNNDRRVDNNDRRADNNDRRVDNNDRRADNNDRRVYNNDRRVDNSERNEYRGAGKDNNGEATSTPHHGRPRTHRPVVFIDYDSEV